MANYTKNTALTSSKFVTEVSGITDATEINHKELGKNIEAASINSDKSGL